MKTPVIRHIARFIPGQEQDVLFVSDQYNISGSVLTDLIVEI